MATKGVVDLVFCLDASSSMRPCFAGVRRHVLDFVHGLQTGFQQQAIDLRMDFVAHSCGENGPFRVQSLRKNGMNMVDALYGAQGQSAFFTTDVKEFERGLELVEVAGDEATLVGLDFAFDMPWRPRNKCHRVVICMTDEPFEDGTNLDEQREKLPTLSAKCQTLGVMLFLVAPDSPVYSELSMIDKSQYEVVDRTNDGLQSVNFSRVLEQIGKSVSVASLQSVGDSAVPRALFGQNRWSAIDAELTGA